MINTIIDLLNKSGADAWEITDSRIEGWEFYFIKHELDQNRAKNVEHIRVTVYKDSEDMEWRGTASADIAPTESVDNIKKTIDDLVFQATLVRNRHYTLNTPSEVSEIILPPFDVSEESGRFIETMSSIPETDTEYLNSYEIFTNKIERRFVNSEGIDVTESYPVSMLEVVVNAKNSDHEIELYRMYDLGTCRKDDIVRDIFETMNTGKNRLVARKTPPLENIPVIFSTSDATHIYEYFLYNLTASFVFRKISGFEIGKPISDPSSAGDKVTVESNVIMEGSASNFAYDAEGARIRYLVLLDKNVPAHYWGGRMFSSYLGLEDSFIVSNWTASGGTRTADQLRSDDYLEVVEFSDFQVDEMTGDIFGEIRLAYWHHDGKTDPVSGGAVSGNMRDNIADMQMSKELRRYNNVMIPSVTKLSHISIAAKEEN